MATLRGKTGYPGVYYREADRVGGKGLERVYYIVFKRGSQYFEEKVGRQYMDNMTPAKASRIRADRIEGRRKSPKELRAEREQARTRIRQRWTFDRIWDEYKSVKTIRGIVTDESRYRKHLSGRMGNKIPIDLTPSVVDRLRSELRKKYAPQTVAHVLALLRRVINFARQRQLCETPAFKIELVKVNNQKTEDLTPKQLRSLLDAIDKAPNRKAAGIMSMALYTGMRKSEILRLKWEDISDKGFITIRAPKGGSDQRIPLNDTAREIIQSQPKTSEYVFPGRDGGRLVNINKEINHIKKAAGLPKKFRPLHGLRHVYASMLASSGQVDMYTLQRLLTHKSPAMTQRYAHLRDEALKKASNLAGEIITMDIGKICDLDDDTSNK
jgi:integrase